VQIDADKTPAKTTVLCVVPQHLDEGQEITLARPELELALGQPVAFPLYTTLRGGKRSGTRSVPVTLAARCTEIGTLELHCVAREGNNRWRLEFNVRDIVREGPATDAAAPEGEEHPA